MAPKHRQPAQKAPPRRLQLTIRDLGAQGDGIAEADGETIFAPLTLPGETITADVQDGRARIVSIDAPSPDRVGQRCPHYGACGGCSLQHMADPACLAFKRRTVISALASKGIGIEVDPVVATPPRSRRRAVLAAGRTPKGFVFGFHGRRTHEIIPITDCPVLTPGLMAALLKIETLARIATPPKGPLVVTATETATGIDVAFSGVGKWFSADERMRLVEAAGATDLARISVDGEVVLERTAPILRAGAAHLTPPPGGFLQASAVSEAAMLQLVSEAVGEARQVADLFAGSGTFSLPLASRAAVHAVESDEAALAALSHAAKRAQGIKPVTIERRDLFRRPLTADELKRFDAVMMDPPRAGAEAQAVNLAKSSVRRLAMVSCNAMTLARDLRILLDGGWRLTRVTPIDQFLWSPHIEVVAALTR